MPRPVSSVVVLWAIAWVAASGFSLRGGMPPKPDVAVLLYALLGVSSEMAAVRLPSFGFFSTGFAVVLALSSAHGPAGQAWALIILTLALSLRALGRGASLRSTLADLAPAACALAAASLFESWQARCLAGIVVYYLLCELCQPQLAQDEDRNIMLTYRTTREWVSLYRWAILFLAPVLVCLHLFNPYYILLGLPMLAGVQRAAFSELSRLRLLDQEILLRKEAQSRLNLAQTRDQLDEANRHLRLREFSESMLLELTRALSLSQDVHNTAQSALQCLGKRIHYRQLAVFVVAGQRLRPLFWMGHSAQPELAPMLEQQVLSGQAVVGTLSVWPLEEEGALMVCTEGKAPLAPEEIYLVGLVASQTALGLQSARRFREQQQSQAGVMQASKMAAVGQLAAGVAHELNTPLGAVQLQLELVETLPGLPAQAIKSLEVAGKALEHSQKIISRLLYYSREGASERQVVDLSQIVEDTLQLLQRQLQIEGVHVELQIEKGCRARVNPNEIQQVLTNLVLNAKDSSLEKGARGKRVLVCTQSSPTGVEIGVFDQGAGVPEEIKERIFEPFFTSKPVGKGVGLGLSVSLELTAQNGGALSVETPPPPWVTHFRLAFPDAGKT